MSKKVLITGTSSGFGNLIANSLLEKGHTVIASMRGVEGKNKEAAEKYIQVNEKSGEFRDISDERKTKLLLHYARRFWHYN